MNGPVALDVSMRSGLMKLRRGEDGAVIIRGVVRSQASIFSWIHSGEHAQRIADDPPIQVSGNSIRIGDAVDRWLLRRVHFFVEIVAPAGTSVRALGDSADLRVEGMDGPVDCETDSGEIQVSAVRSEVSASSDSGSIRVRDVTGSIDVQTDSGEIEAVEIAGGIDAASDSGNLRLDQTKVAPIYARTDSGRIRIQLAQGGYTIRVRTDDSRIEIPELSQRVDSRREVEGVIRGGGSVVAVESDSGDIEIY